MILSDELTAIGRVVRTHGIKGELNVELYDADRVTPADVNCVVFDVDGINVPFFVAMSRPRGPQSCLMTLDDVESDAAAAAFVGKEVFVLSKEVPSSPDDGFLTLDDLVGFRIADTDGSVAGIIDDIDDSTANVLFEVRRPDGSVASVPAAEELITCVDTETKTITMDLPVGLF